MAKVAFTKHERAYLAETIKRYFADDLDQEIGVLQAEEVLDFLTETLGPVFYNRGLLDAEAALSKKMDDFSDVVRALEMPLPVKR
jgi:uncharacterized protein (DUF2164 family)